MLLKAHFPSYSNFIYSEFKNKLKHFCTSQNDPKSNHLLLFVQSLSCVQIFLIPWTAVHQASLSITTSQSLLKLMSIESVMPSNHLILCRFLLHQSFSASGSFLMSWLSTSGGQSTEASVSPSVPPMNTQG